MDYPIGIFILKKKCMGDQMAGLQTYKTSLLQELQEMDKNIQQVVYNALCCQI